MPRGIPLWFFLIVTLIQGLAVAFCLKIHNEELISPKFLDT